MNDGFDADDWRWLLSEDINPLTTAEQEQIVVMAQQIGTVTAAVIDTMRRAIVAVTPAVQALADALIDGAVDEDTEAVVLLDPADPSTDTGP